MKLYIIRHGETDWNKEKRLQGQSDTQLNEYGIELARMYILIISSQVRLKGHIRLLSLSEWTDQ